MSLLDSHGTFLLFGLQTNAPLLGVFPFEYLLLPPRSALKAVPLKSNLLNQFYKTQQFSITF